MAKRIAVVFNEKLKDMEKKLHIQSLCPINRSGTECIKIADDRKLLIDEMTCIGCGICTKAAPEAIKIINLPEALQKSPVHRYGENQFALYNLPTPMFGQVIGIVGINGIGKSTAIKILAGLIKPNFGEYEGEGKGIEEIIKRLKGTEAQVFFEKLKAGEIKVSFKPQHVDLIPKQVSGRVRDILSKLDEKGMLDEYAAMLDIQGILDNEIGNVSGGELQRIAIIACALKKANLYIFDEPTSYLDVKQRLKAASFIRQLASNNEKNDTSVIVVEHDLIILDYMADLVQIMYGSEGVYGVVSQVKSTKTGINAYLEGYLKEENVRFRDHSIKFFERPPKKIEKKSALISWKMLNKKLDNFTLDTGEGILQKGETVGVLGENGTGKTTFVKMLAGVIKEFAGSLDENVTVSYKPQYLEANDELVMVALHQAITKYEMQLIRPLNLKPLFMKKLSELSGGELQRTAIAHCLSQDAQLFLLDEPSAYLDSEQRLVASKVIRGFMEEKNTTALVVDHDLLFLDYLSERLMVFEGKPAVHGTAKGPFAMEEGMNHFLREIGITFRRDEISKRPRANKPESRLDREQKGTGKYYYS